MACDDIAEGVLLTGKEEKKKQRKKQIKREREREKVCSDFVVLFREREREGR